jgi:hypothetical protein
VEAGVVRWWNVDVAVVQVLVVVAPFELAFVVLVGGPAGVVSGVSCVVVVVVAGWSAAGFWAGVIFAQGRQHFDLTCYTRHTNSTKRQILPPVGFRNTALSN